MTMEGGHLLWIVFHFIFLHHVESAGRFSVTPQRTVYIREGETVSLKWEYSIDNGDTFQGMMWISYDPPGSSLKDDQFRLAVKGKSGQPSKTLPDKSESLKGVSLYEGRVKIKDQATLEITNVTLDNMYIVTLLYININGSTVGLPSTEVRVIPTVPPQIISNFSSPLDFIEGNNVIINCSATGKPAPNVTWKNSVSGAKLNQSVSSALLVIKNIRRNSDKNFICTANNVGNTVLKELKLNVLYKPVIIGPTKSIFEVYKAEKNKLVCTADGNPSPTFTWKKGTEKIENGMITTKQTQNGASSNLTLRSVSESSTNDEYVCTATNSQGSAEKTIVLKFAGTDRPTTATTPGGGEPGAGGRSSDPALIGGAVGGSLALILIVVIIIIIIKCRKGRRGSRGYQGRGGYKERGTKSVSDIDDYEPVTKNNELPQYATVDRSKKTPKKSDLNYAELDHQNQSERSVDARPAKRNNEPTTYAEIVQTWEPTNERTYANVPRRGLNSSEML